MGIHFFVDETKAKSYVVVAASCPSHALADARRAMGRLVLPGQRSIHMKHESQRRRRQITDALTPLLDAGWAAMVLDAGRGPEPERARRERALRAVVARAAAHDTATVVLDLDRTIAAQDRRVIAEALGRSGVATVSYSHLTLSTEPLLAVPDIIAWCWARGGEWRKRVAPLVNEALIV